MKEREETIELVIIEDNHDDAELILRTVRKKGYLEKTLHLLNGEEALVKLLPKEPSESINPRLIILDIKMPKIDGFKVLEKLKRNEKTCFIPVLIFSSSKQDTDIRKAYELGANCFLVKPLDYQHFNDTVENILEFWLTHNTII